MKKIIIQLFIIISLLLSTSPLYGKTISERVITINELSITTGGLSDETGETINFYKEDNILNMKIFINSNREIKCVKITTKDKGIFFIFDVKKMVFNSGSKYRLDKSLINQRQRENFKLLVIQKTIDELIIP